MAETPRRTDIDFDEFRKRLLKEQASILAVHREQEADMRAESESAATDELDRYPTFDPADNTDAAAVLNDRERENALDANEVEILKRIDAALERLDDGTYGIDAVTGVPIPVARLRALPWATMTVENAERYNT